MINEDVANMRFQECSYWTIDKEEKFRELVILYKNKQIDINEYIHRLDKLHLQ